MAKKWDPFKRDYSDFEVQDGWVLRAYSDDMEAETTCPQCGEKYKYGSMYTSQEIYTDNGLWGFSVCESCHFEEMDRRAKAEGWE